MNPPQAKDRTKATASESEVASRSRRRTGSGGRGRKPSVMPPQHGAWAFLGLPILLGITASSLTWLTGLLAIGFVLAFPTSHFAIAVHRYPRPQQYYRGLLVWSTPAVAIAIVVVIARPWMLWVGLLYLVAFAVNLGFAKAHNERSLINDAVFIIECVAIIPIIWACSASAGGLVPPPLASAPGAVWTISALAALALVGSTMHVRSLIREKRNASFRRASQIFALISIALAVALALPYGTIAVIIAIVAFGYLGARAFLVGRRPMRPGLIGVFELFGFIAVYLAGVAVIAG